MRDGCKRGRDQVRLGKWASLTVTVLANYYLQQVHYSQKTSWQMKMNEDQRGRQERWKLKWMSHPELRVSKLGMQWWQAAKCVRGAETKRKRQFKTLLKARCVSDQSRAGRDPSQTFIRRWKKTFFHLEYLMCLWTKTPTKNGCVTAKRRNIFLSCQYFLLCFHLNVLFGSCELPFDQTVWCLLLVVPSPVSIQGLEPSKRDIYQPLCLWVTSPVCLHCMETNMICIPGCQRDWILIPQCIAGI